VQSKSKQQIADYHLITIHYDLFAEDGQLHHLITICNQSFQMHSVIHYEKACQQWTTTNGFTYCTLQNLALILHYTCP